MLGFLKLIYSLQINVLFLYNKFNFFSHFLNFFVLHIKSNIEILNLCNFANVKPHTLFNKFILIKIRYNKVNNVFYLQLLMNTLKKYKKLQYL